MSRKFTVLNPRQERLAQLLALGKVKSQLEAGKLAGYTGKHVDVSISKAVNSDKVQARIKEIQTDVARSQAITKESVLAELARIAFSNVSDVIDFSYDPPRLRNPLEIPEDAWSIISGVKTSFSRDGTPIVEVKFHDKKQALSDLMNYLGLNTERVEISGPNGAPMDTNFTVQFVEKERDVKDITPQQSRLE